jgi:TonB-linked SusC/RagA family outer membrane protein
MKTIRAWSLIFLGILLVQEGADAQGPTVPGGYRRAARAPTLLDRPARLIVRDAKLADALTQLSETSAVPVAFSPSLVAKEWRRVDCDCREVSIRQALSHLLENTALSYRELRGEILVGEYTPDPIVAAPRYAGPIMLTSSALETLWAPKEPRVRQGTVTGVVTESGTMRPLATAQVVVLGTSLGAFTGADGRFEIRAVPSGQVEMQVRLLGYATASRTVTIPSDGTVTVNFQLEQAVLALDGLVVTALGIERGVRSLTYSAQSVETSQMTMARELNVVNSLQGKVAGLSINQSATGVGGDSYVILRGNRSIAGSSQPLYVVDGVPIRGGIGDINPDDIANIDVLKGPNAAALYGAAAQNGAVVITTHRAPARSGIRFSMSQTLMAEKPILADNYQNIYGQGTGGIYSPNSEFSWGPRMEGQKVDYWKFGDSDHMDGLQYDFLPQPNNIRDAFRTGYNSSTNITASIGAAETQAHVSYTYTDAKGMIPGNNLDRQNISLRVSSQLLDRLSIDSRFSYMRQDIANQLATGENFTNPLRHIYRLPRNIRTEDIKNFEYTNIANANRQNYFNVGSNGGANPYWTLNRNLRQNVRDRVLGMASLKYSFTDQISLMARASYDGSNNQSETRLYNDTYIDANFGQYALTKANATLWNGDFLLSYAGQLTGDWSFDANMGGSIQQRRNTSLTGTTGTALIIPNFFTLTNSLNPQTTHSIGAPADVHSLYGFTQIGWRNALFLDITGRNDWSSTLPANNRSYFYPSVGLSAVVTDLYPGLPEALSFARVRTSWARVGSDTDPFRLTRLTQFISGGNNGFLRLLPTLPNVDLRPERTESIEVGADIGILDGRLGLDFTWYKSNTTDQLFTVALPVGSGASEFFTNGGDVENRGAEVLFRTVPLMLPAFRWGLDINYSRNRNMVKKLNDERPSLETTRDYLRAYRIEEGKPFGQVYSRGFRRDEQGRVIVGQNGVPLVTDGMTVPVANFNPDWLASISNTVRYRNFQLNVLIDHRQGGTIASLRNAILYADGLTTGTLPGRDGGLIFGKNLFGHEEAVLEDGSPNNIEVNAETFWRSVGGRNAPVGEAFVEDATNTRLREVTLGHTFSPELLARMPVTSMTVSLVGRNLFFIHRKSENLDPDILVNTAASAQGFESFTPPTGRTFGLDVRFTF